MAIALLSPVSAPEAHSPLSVDSHAPTALLNTLNLAQARTARAGLPERLVLALDGLPHKDVEKLQREEGLFSDFFPASRNIAPFPSVSDISWADIFRTVPPRGYQRYHYSVGGNQIIGGSTTDLGNPIEYEKRMHLTFMKLTEHAYAYVFPMRAAYDEVNAVIDRLLRSRDGGTFYSYLLSSDTLQHTNGDIHEFLRYLDGRLKELQRLYSAASGGKRLKIVIVSDHGHNHQAGGKLVGMKAHLESKGLTFADSVKGPDDVVFTNAGILTSVAIFTLPANYERVARAALEAEGVDLATYIDAADADLVHLRKPGGDYARIRRKAGSNRYKYEAVQGDPIGYLPIVTALTEAGKADDKGYIHADAWLDATSDHEYPVAPERIWRGHHVITLNTAPIIVAIKDGYENANSLVKFASNFSTRGGTHGNLGKACSNGVVMTNYTPTRDLTSNRTGEFLSFGGLFNHRRHRRGARLADTRVIAYDIDTGEMIDSEDNLAPQNQVFLNLWDPQVPAFDSVGLRTEFVVTVRRDGFLMFNGKVTRKAFFPDSLPRTQDKVEYRIPMRLVAGDYLEPGSYFITAEAVRRDPSSGFVIQRSKITELRFFTDVDGHVVAY